MASQDRRYILVGFSDTLDCRALKFIEPIPTDRICSACGTVPAVTTCLPNCQHTVCKSCYEKCRLDDSSSCPLDGQHFAEDEVDWTMFPLENLLSRKVKCWNEERGCDAVLSASDTNKHFLHECGHHTTSCPKCSVAVLRKDVCRHLRSQCREYAEPPTFAAPKTSNAAQKGMTALKARTNARTNEMIDSLNRAISDHNARIDRLNDISHCVNALKMFHEVSKSNVSISTQMASKASASLSLTKELQEISIGHNQELNELAEALDMYTRAISEVHENSSLPEKRDVRPLQAMVKDHMQHIVCNKVRIVKETLRKELHAATMTVCRDLEERSIAVSEAVDIHESGPAEANKENEGASNTIVVKCSEFFVKNIGEIKERALSKGPQVCSSDKLSMPGYHVTPAVCLAKQGEHVFLCPFIQPDKEVHRDFIQRPYKHDIRLTVKHPSRRKQCQVVSSIFCYLEGFISHEEQTDMGPHSRDVFRLDCLEQEGYVHDDQLWIVWELVPQNVAE